MKKLLGLIFLYVLITALLLPALITVMWKRENNTNTIEMPEGFNQEDLVEAKQEEEQPIALAQLNELESYIAGVVAAEMPALFPEEALKAQAVAARTYAVRKMDETGDSSFPLNIGQAYIDEAARKERWGDHFLVYEKKINDAVWKTQGEIMVYENEPILAVFHAQSAGQTETAENIWSSPLPYLKSVDSSNDALAPDFQTDTEVSCQEAVKVLKNNENPSLTAENIFDSMKIVSRSPAGYVTSMDVAGRIMTGREVREALGLRSTNFTFRLDGKNLIFTTKGYGHGAGMSQYGAKFMAEDGKNYHEILNHYYVDIQFKSMS